MFLAGHFSAGNLLASDYLTQLSAAEVAASTADLTDTLVLALGCHGGLNIPGQDAIPGVSPSPDWPEAMAQKGATLLAATGYAYGDTVLTEYGERLFVDVAQQLRTGTGGVPIGVANVAAKQEYLNTHVDLGGIDEKTLLETTLYGLPMLQVKMPGQRTPPTSDSIVSSAPTVTAGPGAALGLAVGQTAAGSPEIEVTPTTTTNTVTLTDASGGNPETASWLSGASGVVTHPLDPVFPLQLYNATVSDQVLRGIGFRGGSYTDLPGVTPLTGAPSTETSVGHPAFFSDVFYPTQVWSANYFDTVDGLNRGLTSLAVAPAQYKSSSPGATSGTMRQFTDLKFRLYYLGNSELVSQIGTGAALDSAPNIIGAASTEDATNKTVTFQVRVQNNLLPGSTQEDLQDVWVTYNDPGSSGAAATEWTSLDLTPSPGDPSLWTGTAPGLSYSTVYMVQAANATGLVSLDTNNGAYFTVAPDSAPNQVTPTLTLQSPPASGAYQSSAQFTVSLHSGGVGIPDQAVGVHIGSEEAIAETNDSGHATVTLPVGQTSVTMPLGQSPGTYDLWASYEGATVGSTAYDAVSSSVGTFKIDPASTMLTLAPASASTTYGSSQSTGIVATLQANGTGLAQKSVYFTITSITGASVSQKVAITDAGGNAALAGLSLPAGTYGVTAAFGMSSPDPNYLGSSAPGTATLTITPAGLTITAGSPTMAYGGTVPVITPSYSGFVNGDGPSTLTTMPTCAVTTTPNKYTVGSYATSCMGAADANYSISYAAGTLSVTPASLLITASSASMTYGGPEPAISPIYNGLVNGNAAPATPPTCIGVSPSSPVNSYTTSCSGASDPNYSISYGTGKLTVMPASLTITASSPSMTYGGTVPAITASFTGLVNGDSSTSEQAKAACTTTATSNSPVGSYPTSCTLNDADYSPTYVTGTLTIIYPPLYLAMVVTSSSSGPVTTGSTVTASFTLGNHTASTQTVSVNAKLVYTGSNGSLTVNLPLSFSLKAGQTVSQSVSFPITKSFPRGTYMLTLTAKDGSSHTATSSATLTVA